MEQEKIINIEELVQDEHNFNKGTDEGGKLMERSFKEMGAGRSVLIDKHGKIIAGNKRQKAAIAAGIKRVRVIETTGDELIAVKRTDVELESEQGRKMALLDNLTTQVNLAWDEAELQTITGEIEGFDVGDFGFDIKDMPSVDFEGKKKEDPDAGADVNPDDYGDEIGWQGGDKSPFTQITFVVANEQADFINSMLSEAKKQDGYGEEYGNTNSNGNAIYLIVKQWAEQKKLS